MELNSDTLLSVGIDIGTTTTHLVVSSLKFSNVARPTQIHNLRLTDKEVLFESAVFETPLTSGLIDAAGVAAIVAEAYREAELKIGLDMKSIQTGAVIITGESARTRNAAAVLGEIAEFAGEFVVESAGPSLESILCARGSGAATLSKEESMRILNVDIGGGTSNFALLDSGTIVDTSVIFIGGRAVRFHLGKIAATGDLPRTICDKKKIDLKTGDDEAGRARELALLADEMSSILMLEIKKFAPELIVVSGGVAELIRLYKESDKVPPTNYADNKFEDFGVYLARSLNDRLLQSGMKYLLAPNAIRATVLGAGLHTLQLTGSTIDFAGDSLPLRNIPLLKIDASNWDNIVSNIRNACNLKELDWSKTPVTLALTGLDRRGLQYQNIKRLAQALAQAQTELEACEPIVITAEQDIAMALGLLLKRLLPDKRIITVDGVSVADGDYLDIGRPVHSNSPSDQYTAALPVVVKTLVFYKN